MMNYNIKMVVCSNTNNQIVFYDDDDFFVMKVNDKEFLKTYAKTKIEAFYTEEYYKNKSEHSLGDYVNEKVNAFGKIKQIGFHFRCERSFFGTPHYYE